MSDKKNIIFICTGNACRSQIAHGLLEKKANERFNVFSAGSHPSRVHSMAIKVMEEIGIDISHHKSDHLQDLLDCHSLNHFLPSKQCLAFCVFHKQELFLKSHNQYYFLLKDFRLLKPV